MHPFSEASCVPVFFWKSPHRRELSFLRTMGNCSVYRIKLCTFDRKTTPAHNFPVAGRYSKIYTDDIYTILWVILRSSNGRNKTHKPGWFLFTKYIQHHKWFEAAETGYVWGTLLPVWGDGSRIVQGSADGQPQWSEGSMRSRVPLDTRFYPFPVGRTMPFQKQFPFLCKSVNPSIQ